MGQSMDFGNHKIRCNFLRKKCRVCHIIHGFSRFQGTSSTLFGPAELKFVTRKALDNKYTEVQSFVAETDKFK